jgi:hypothetical protein
VLDDAHMTWVAAEVESEHALGAWFDAGARQSVGRYLAYHAAVDPEEAVARDLHRPPARIRTLGEAKQDCETRTSCALLVAQSRASHPHA